MTPLANDLLNWLLDGDIAIQYQVYRDLLDEERPDLRARIATEGWGARFLAARQPEGHWGRGFYQPKWISTHYTLLDMKHLGVSPDQALIRKSISHILAHHKSADGGVNPAGTIKNSDVCINGMFLNYAAYFKLPAKSLHSIVDFLAELHLQTALSAYRQLNHKHSEAITLNSLGELARERQNYPEAEDYYRQALALAETLGNKEYQDGRTPDEAS